MCKDSTTYEMRISDWSADVCSSDLAAKREALREAMRSDALGAAGIPGGTADRNQSGGGGSDNGYAAKVRACVRPQVIYNVPQQQGNSNPTVQYRAKQIGRAHV